MRDNKITEIKNLDNLVNLRHTDLDYEIPIIIGILINFIPNEECAICYEEYKQEDKIIKLKCNHIFHQKCIEDSYNIGNLKTCPYCRTLF